MSFNGFKIKFVITDIQISKFEQMFLFFIILFEIYLNGLNTTVMRMSNVHPVKVFYTHKIDPIRIDMFEIQFQGYLSNTFREGNSFGQGPPWPSG